MPKYASVAHKKSNKLGEEISENQNQKSSGGESD